MRVDRAKLEAFVERAFGDVGAAMTASLVVLGDRLGLYRALASNGPSTSVELAGATGTSERHVREWLRAQAAALYVDYDDASGRYGLSPEQAAVFADESGTACMLGGFQLAVAAGRAVDRLEDSFRSGSGLAWHEHDEGVPEGTARFFRPAYVTHLAGTWIPALRGVADRLRLGALVADVGCGRGVSTMLMARAFPASVFVGFDDHADSIDAATREAETSGLAGRCRFETRGAKDLPAADWDLVAFLDCLHDMGDPVGTLRRARRALADDGTVMVVEPRAGDSVEDNLTPVGRVYYAASTLVCTPASLAQDVGAALGAQAGEARLREVLASAGFAHVRKAAETRHHMVLEARKT